MPTPQKEQTVAELSRLLKHSRVAILTDYRGMTVSEISALRRQLAESGVEFHVAKNTLTRRAAADRVSGEAVDKLLTGPTAIAFGKEDEVKAARTLTGYVRGTRTVLKIKGGILGSQVLGAEDVERLSTLPPRELLIAQVLGGLQSPLAGLLSVLQGNVRSLASVLDARRKQMEEGSATPASAAAG